MAENKTEWTEQLRDLTDRIVNREKFDFDVNGEALMKQYQDQFRRQGQTAMMDTMGQAQAMTGGYGNSYAQSVGQQTYQNYMQGATDKIPELYQLALSKYQAEGDNLRNLYSIVSDRENQAYSKFIDDRNYQRQQAIDERNWQYQQERDKIADQRWQTEFDEDKRRYEQQWAADHPTGRGGGGGDGNPTPHVLPTDWESEYLTLKMYGAGARELDSYLRERIREGDLTEEQATELRNKRY